MLNRLNIIPNIFVERKKFNEVLKTNKINHVLTFVSESISFYGKNLR